MQSGCGRGAAGRLDARSRSLMPLLATDAVTASAKRLSCAPVCRHDASDPDAYNLCDSARCGSGGLPKRGWSEIGCATIGVRGSRTP